ncbi:serine-rich adhesin for platelets-like isoform X2 [Sycon ciliatum]|uniref:serine-rich adhesin for platelets-like isoform X2 n=1 Tax=Sycon ciliatum TaxID=27933 RepID=UPI0031F70041
MASAGVLIGCLLLFCPLLLIGSNGQAVTLRAAGTGQSTTYLVTFGDGQPTVNVPDYLPLCLVSDGSGPFIRLEKTDGSLVLFESAISGITVVQLNSAARPMLNTSYTGLYHCRTATHNSSDTYQLNIVARQNRITVTPTTMVFNYTDQRYDIPCNTVGSSGMNVTWTSTLDLKTKMVNTVNGTSQNGLLEYVNSTFSFMGNDSSIMLTRDNPAGVRFNVTCTTAYRTSYICRFVDTSGSARQPPQDALDRCDGAVESLSTTYSIIIQAPCKDISPTSSNNYDTISNFSTTPGTTVAVQCKDGFVSSSSMDVTSLTCMASGHWSPSPPTCDACSTICRNTNVTSCAHIKLANIPGAIDCPCTGTDTVWTTSAGGCVPTHCPAVGNTTTTNAIPRLAVGTSRYVACNNGYSPGKTVHNTSCVSNGTLTHQPDCKDIDECNTMCNGSSSQCNNTLGSFLCTCDPGFTGDGFNCTDASTLEESNLAPALNESATSTLAPTLNQSATSTLNQSATSMLAPDLNQSATSTLNQSTTSTLAPALNQSATSIVALLSDGGADPTSSVPDIGETPVQSDSVMSTGSTTTFNSTLDIPNGKSSLTGGQVAGLVIGTLLLVALIGGIVFTLVKKQSPGSGKHISMTEMNA